MAIVECSECKGKISSYAKTCVHCGYPINYINSTNAEEMLTLTDVQNHLV